MHEDHFLYLVIIMFASIFGYGGYLIWNYSVQFSKWKTFALKHHCQVDNFHLFFYLFRSNLPQMWGVLDGHKYVIAIEIERAGYGRANRIFTRIYLHFERPICSPFTITSISMINRLTQKLGYKDVKTGNHSFDNKFWITGTSPEKIRATLSNTAVLTKMTTYLMSFHKKSKITNELVYYEYIGIIPDCETLERTVTFMAKMATGIESSISQLQGE